MKAVTAHPLRLLDYPGALRLLEQLGNEITTAKFGLENIRTLCAALGNPELAYPSVLIAGTNGKGSTAATLFSILSHAGFRVGCYTSPHLVHPRERIRTGRHWISETEFAARIDEVESAVQTLLKGGKLAAHPTYFEMLTAAAFLHFRMSSVEIAVLEVGLGGRLDATNVCRPIVTIITSISLDHQQYLGHRIEQIAGEKAGILRQDIPVLLGPMGKTAHQEILSHAARQRAVVYDLAARATITPTENRNGYYDFDLDLDLSMSGGHFKDLRSSLRGPQQPVNTALAVLGAALLDKRGFVVGRQDIIEGIRETHWPGRLHAVAQDPLLILDGAHNLQGVRNLGRFLKDCYPRGDLLLIFGVMGDKDYVRLAEVLFPRARDVFLTAPNNSRAVGVKDLRIALEGKFPCRLYETGDVSEALARAREHARQGCWILLTGSLYLVGEALEALGIDPTSPDACTPVTWPGLTPG